MNSRFNLRSLLVSAIASTVLLQASVSFADDTEIFFGGATVDSGIQPNVLFVLDNSGSMAGTRMTDLKKAFNTIISSAGKINVGVMTMNTSNNKPRLLSPVQDINQPMNFKLATPELLVSGDDASRIDGSTVPATSASTNISDPTLVMGYVKNADASGVTINTITRSVGKTSPYDSDNSSYYVQKSGTIDYVCSAKITEAASVCPAGGKTEIAGGSDGILLFRNLNIPASASITSAKLYLAPTNASAAPAFSVKIENTKTAAAFNSDTTFADHNFGVSNLQTTTSSSALVGGEAVLDVTTALGNLKAVAPAKNPIADVAMRIGTSSSYPWKIGNGNDTAPRLVVTWTNNESVTRTTGIRFQNVAIPKGAVITSARIDFVPAASDDRPVTYTVSAQNIGEAPVFTSSEDFTARTKTSNTATWIPPEWRTTAPQVSVEGPIVTGLVQSVIDNNADWCGNNSMAFFITPIAGSGSRTAFSVDAAQDLQPVLNVSYTGGNTGCLNPVIKVSVYDPKDDASQSAATSKPTLTGASNAFNNGFIGSRYTNVPVVRNAVVLDTQLIVTPTTASSADGIANVFFENVGFSDPFTTTAGNISGRTLTAGTSCTFTRAGAGVPITCGASALKTQLQSVFARSDWADGNALSVILKPTSGAANFALQTRETSAEVGVQLRIKLQDGGLGSKGYTVREYTNGIVQALNPSGGTPIVPTLYDAAKYLVQTPGKHIGTDPSPMTSSCQANYLVFLTDGEANGTSDEAKAGINTLIGKSCTGDSGYDSEKCARSLATWMSTADMADFSGINNVKTSTIGFNTSNNNQATLLLNALAKNGGGTAYQADNASQLVTAFDAIVQSALATNTTFVNASAPINSFNRADNLDQLYFALFKPSEYDRWSGNLKRYRLKTAGATATIVDADEAAAIDVNTGFFKTTARSFWNTSQDGADITKGGAAANLPAPDDRKLFTYTGANPAGSATTLEALTSANTNVTKELLGDGSMDTTARANLISYIRGGPDATGTTLRKALGDPIHSLPRLVTYGCSAYTGTTCTTPDLSVIMGSNEGYVHAFDTDNGVEQFAYMPKELLRNIKQLRDNLKSSETKPRRYGMDNTVTVWANDANNNGVIYGNPTASPPTTGGLNSGEFVYAYATQGRGGNNIYALDITDRGAPKMLWQIIGGVTPGFENLGQTWSAPTKTRIKVGDDIVDVLIFGGGYDTRQDDLDRSTSLYADDSVGNSIYIVNAKTGAKIWSAGKAASGFTVSLPKMKYSIPSSVRAIDLQQTDGVLVADADKLADQFFVGDMGGQVWRFYINNGSTGSNLITPAGTSQDGVFASIGNATTPAGARRFYNEPDVSLLNVNGTLSLAVSIGSGYRGHPLNKYIQDRFYAFRTAALFKASGEGTLTEANLYDASANVTQSSSASASDKAAAKTAFARTTGGWFINMVNSGEKVLSRALTANGVVYFNSYEPSTSTAACSAAVGVNRAYSVRLMDATASRVAAGDNATPADRYSTSTSGGIAGDPSLWCEGTDCYVLTGNPDLEIPEAGSPPIGKTYWIDQSNLD